jgi:hypothetical protein
MIIQNVRLPFVKYFQRCNQLFFFVKPNSGKLYMKVVRYRHKMGHSNLYVAVDPWTSTIRDWKDSFELRKKLLEPCGSFHEYLSKFPCLENQYGLQLVIFSIIKDYHILTSVFFFLMFFF